MKKITFLIIFVLVALVANAQIARYVKVTATGTGDGTSWANAAGNSSIQAMIDAVAADANKGTVYFAAGTYMPSATINIKDGANMMGGYAADGSGTRDLNANQTILDGAANKRILYATDANTTAAFTKITTIDGFILQRGSSSYGSAAFITYGVVLLNCIIRNNNGTTYGSAIMAKRTSSLSSPTTGWNMSCALINCLIINNSSSNYAAGVWIDQDAHFSMINCVIANNKSTDATNGIGGLYVGPNIRYSRMTNNIFYNNSSAVSSTKNNFYSTTTNFAGTFSNYFSDATIPVGGVTGLGNKTSTDYASPGFVSPTSFQGYTTNSSSITEINNSNWRLSSTSPLIGLGISTSNADLPYPYSTMASFGSTNKIYSSISTDIMGSDRIISTNPEMGVYEYNPITITAATADAGMGSVSGTTTVSKGSNVTLTATPTSGAYTFVNWTNGATVLSSNSSYTFAAATTLTATANFQSFAAMTPTVTYARSANTIDVLVTNPTGYTGTITYNVLDGSDNVLATGVAKSAQASTLVYAASGLTANTSYTYKVVAVLDGSTNSQTTTLNATTRKYKNGSIEVIDDFESGDLGWTGLSGGVVISPFTNPTSSGINISANVAKVSIASGQQSYSGIMNVKEKIQVGPTAPYKYLHLKFKRTSDNGGLNLTFLARNDISQAQMEPALISYAATMIDGIWYDYVFDLSAVDAADKTVFGFYIRPNKTTANTSTASISYIDDIYLSNSATASTANITTQVSVSASTGGTTTATATYITGDNVSLTSTPSSNYHFVNWTEYGSQVSTNATYTFTASTNRTLVANFEPNTVSVNSGVTNASTITCTTCDVTVASGAELSVGATKTLKSVTVVAGGKLTLTAGTLTATNGITLESDENGTATMLQSGTLTGTVIAKQYLGSARNWYVSSPIASATSPANNVDYYYEYVEAGDNNPAGQPGSSTVYWKGLANGTTMEVGKGYIAKTNAGTTIQFSGTPNNGNITTSFNLTRNDAKGHGFNLVGNPYPSYIDWTAVAAANTNLDNTYYYRTKNSSDAYTFVTWNGAGSNYVVSNGSLAVNTTVTRYIPPTQAFWVRVKSGTASTSMNFTNAMREHRDDNGNLMKACKQDNRISIRLQLQNGINADELLIYQDVAASNGYDAYDSPKMMNNSAVTPDLYTLSGTERLVINGLKEVTNNMELPLGFSLNAAASLKLKATEMSNLPVGTRVYLLDKTQSTQTELLPETEYSFNSTATSFNEGRFSLVFRTSAISTDVNAGKDNERILVSKNPNNQIVININGELMGDKTASVYNTVGQKLVSISLSNPQTVISNPLSAGVYLVTVKSGGKNFTGKIILN